MPEAGLVQLWLLARLALLHVAWGGGARTVALTQRCTEAAGSKGSVGVKF